MYLGGKNYEAWAEGSIGVLRLLEKELAKDVIHCGYGNREQIIQAIKTSSCYPVKIYESILLYRIYYKDQLA